LPRWNPFGDGNLTLQIKKRGVISRKKGRLRQCLLLHKTVIKKEEINVGKGSDTWFWKQRDFDANQEKKF